MSLVARRGNISARVVLVVFCTAWDWGEGGVEDGASGGSSFVMILTLRLGNCSFNLLVATELLGEVVSEDVARSGAETLPEREQGCFDLVGWAVVDLILRVGRGRG